MYYIGEIIKRLCAGKILSEKSAGQGNNDALLNLALMYRDGKGVNKKSTKAISLYLNAANKIIPLAQHSLHVCIGMVKVEADDEQAFKWCQKSQNKGTLKHNITLPQCT